MINILFSERNAFFISGLESIIRDLINLNSDANVNFLYEITNSNISQADVIIKSFESGEQFLCQEILLGRHKFCLVIGVFKNLVQHSNNEIPKCIEGAIFIDYKIPTSKFSEILINHLSNIVTPKFDARLQRCLKCNAKSLKGPHIEIFKRIFIGQCQYQIAKSMGLNVKSISSYKRKLMRDFRLKNTFELHSFMSLYMKKNGL